jgi:RimJ/RimL family protein N-acetyltransferase
MPSPSVTLDVQPPTEPLTDGVVTLRRLRAGDRPAVLGTMADPLVRRWLNMPEQPTETDFDELLRAVSDGWSAGTRLDLAITDSADTVLGAVIASKRHRDNWELAYLAAETGRSRGLVTRSVKLVCAWLLGAGVGRIEIRTHPENDASQRVAERCGFSLEGRERRSIWLHGRRQDALVWSLLPGDRQE